MSRGPRFKVAFRRRRHARTDYRKRLALLKGGKPRAVVRKTSRNTIAQFIRYDRQGDLVAAAAISQELGRYGWKGSTSSVPAAYLTGYLAGKRAVREGIEEAVLDVGLYPPTKGSRVFAALRGMVEAGVAIPHGEGITADDARLRGEHITEETIKHFDKVKAELEALK